MMIPQDLVRLSRLVFSADVIAHPSPSMGERKIRRLLTIGARAAVLQANRRGAPRGSWIESMVAREPRMHVSVALANKMARMVWALLT